MPNDKLNNVPRRPTIGVLAGWQFYWTATPLSYLDPDLPRHSPGRSQRSTATCCSPAAWAPRPTRAIRCARPGPILLPDTDFVPIGPWNTDGLIAVNPLNSPARSRYLHELAAGGHPIVYIASGEQGPAIVADNAGGDPRCHAAPG